jgi:hypothetical protein
MLATKGAVTLGNNNVMKTANIKVTTANNTEKVRTTSGGDGLRLRNKSKGESMGV